MIENILFPVDFSLSCAAMAAYVKRAAVICGARVTQPVPGSMRLAKTS